jgi:hypothetical protein
MMDSIHAIQEVITLYGQLLDDLEMARWGELFADESVWAMPGFIFEGRAAIVKGVRAMEPDRPGLVKHLAFSPVIHLDGDCARAWTDLMFLSRTAYDAPWLLALTGRYCDEFIAENGVWRFAKRVCDIAPDDPPKVPFERRPPPR